MSDIGLRIERLFYLGFILIFACWIELYFVEVAAYFSNPQNRSVDALLVELKANLPELESTFAAQQQPKTPQDPREQAVSKLRQELGIPPEKKSTNNSTETSYQEVLTKIYTKIYIHNQPDPDLAKKLEVSKSPQTLIIELEKYKESLQKNSATVFGVESPRQLSFQYGSSDFKIPPSLLSTILLIAIQPLAMIWLGSFYITRQRELLLTTKSKDYKQTFPHILNWFVVDFSAFNSRIGFNQSRKQQKSHLVTAAIFTTLFRCLIVLMLALLIISPTTYATIAISSNESTSTTVIAISWIFLIINIMICLQTLTQEALALKGKVFYE
jgi:hypothetical protein